ncbi:MAG: DMT family transporter [Actinobacteria bacterium]|nr:DMT family transporter [Actinomycetota bacterium]
MTALALLASLLWGGADFVAGTATKRLHPLAVTGAVHAVGFVGLLGWALAAGGLAGWREWLPLALAAGVLGYVGLAAFYLALARGPMGVVAPIAAGGSALPVAVDLARGVVPPPLQLAGLALAVVGAILASGPDLRSGRITAAVLAMTLFSAVSYGVLMLVVAHGSEQYPAQTLMGLRLSSVVLAGGLALAVRGLGGLRRSDAGTIAFVGIGDTGANVAYALASTRGQVGVAVVLSSLFPVVTAVLARIVHDERLRAVQVVGVAGAVAGVVLIAVG